MNIYYQTVLCKIQLNEIISIKDNVERRSRLIYWRACRMPNEDSSHIFTSCERSIILYYVGMIMRLIPLNFYSFFFFSLSFIFYLNFAPHADVPASGIFTRIISNLLAFFILSLQGSAKRCFSWLLLLDLRLYLFFFLYFFFFFLILYYALVLDCIERISVLM